MRPSVPVWPYSNDLLQPPCDLILNTPGAPVALDELAGRAGEAKTPSGTYVDLTQ